MPSIRQRFHLSPCSDFRSHFCVTKICSDEFDTWPLHLHNLGCAYDVLAGLGVDQQTTSWRVPSKFSSSFIITCGSELTTVEEGSLDYAVTTGDGTEIVFTVTAGEDAAASIYVDVDENGNVIVQNLSDEGAPAVTFTIDGVDAGSINPGDPPLDIDTTPPVVTAALVPVGDSEDRDSDEGVFRVEFSVADNSDPAPSVIAVLEVPGLADTPVTNGQVIEFEADDEDSEVEYEDGILEVEAPSLTLRVTGTDAAGNSAEATDTLTGLTGDNDDNDGDNDDDDEDDDDDDEDD